ncbi:BTH_I0359 family protein [Aquabacterium sp. OR-4]|uniref:BTH_I0359 family protein n=1 Tax=Aquabacterium sp. OR-4 TaxID=2978127 RepID=UPI0021B27997|nr:DUF3567 domain-containing protein [Aquabacterium sp. OR-4]MDT7837808.1 DUF3567 domain-containing protein [Aquabacterium sp. OR-4]
MQMLYNSDHFVVVAFDLSGDAVAAAPLVAAAPAAAPSAAVEPTEAAAADVSPTVPAPPRLGGYEIVDKLARKEIFIQGAVAASFQQGVQALVAQGPDPEALDEFIGSFTTLAQQPVVLH